MDKIDKLKISIERLTKVWLSKIKYEEEELVAEDMIWLSESFDGFFEKRNFDDFVNIAGRYEEAKEIEDFSFTDILESISVANSNKDEYWKKRKVERPNQFDYFKQLNELRAQNNYQYNVIDSYIKVIKILYYAANKKDLQRTKSILISVVSDFIRKVCVFERSDVNELVLLNNFLIDLRSLFSETEIRDGLPSRAFLKSVLFETIFLIYYQSWVDYKKVPILNQHFLSVFKMLILNRNDDLLEDFLSSLSNMTLSSWIFREIDIYDIKKDLRSEDYNSEFYLNLRKVSEKNSLIISKDDLEQFLDLIEKVKNDYVPDYFEENKRDYFLDVEKNRAIEIYKFRQIQVFILEYLGQVLHFNGKDVFVNSVKILRRNEALSNHLKFFPDSSSGIVLWLILFGNLERRMVLSFEPSLGSNYRKYILNYILTVSGSVELRTQEITDFLLANGLDKDSSFLNSLMNLSNSIEKEVESSELLEHIQKKRSGEFWSFLSDYFKEQVSKSEKDILIPDSKFNDFAFSIFRRYSEKSLIYQLSSALNNIGVGLQKGKQIKTHVQINDILFRKYLIPDWHVPVYGLNESIGNSLVEDEAMKFEFGLFDRYFINNNDKKYKRNDVKILFENLSPNSILLFRNVFPDYWLRQIPEGEIDRNNVFEYKTYDRNPGLIIIPKGTISVQYIYEKDVEGMKQFEDKFFWEILDLGAGNFHNIMELKKRKGFLERFKLSDVEFQDFFWMKFSAQSLSLVYAKDSIKAYSLDPYGE
ncbi:hypothetical protein SYJ56_04780 [Algoriphagus sp. D3-2-R+10]|uniref:hypothetical protein n=1 Tax=Algoriphagus aurantiacus TaxID=3103948 RepID=UPI002B36A2FB|nr:hypothetical protein [Algoriphagus sp. D3-2-R+10]MEB2774608.1 hypothetical protein [Algoriphagus sp. D3-2-R+10]